MQRVVITVNLLSKYLLEGNDENERAELHAISCLRDDKRNLDQSKSEEESKSQPTVIMTIRLSVTLLVRSLVKVTSVRFASHLQSEGSNAILYTLSNICVFL
jgi:hypothetical protein